MPQPKPYQLGEFDYNECFSGRGGFLSPDGNEEKHMISFYLEVLAEELAKKGVVFGCNRPILWLEPGIGDGSSTIKFIRAISKAHSAGVVIYGSDYQENYINEARAKLTQLKDAKISIGELLVKDAFSGEQLASKPCDFALLSHFIYHIKNQLDGKKRQDYEAEIKLARLVQGVMNSIGENALALAFHEGPASDMGGKIGITFGAAMHDATERMAKAAADNNKCMIRIPLESKLYFPDLPSERLDEFKDLNNWKKYEEDSLEASWLKKLLFALHNTPQAERGIRGGVVDLAREPSRGANSSRLGDLIDYMKSLLKRNENGPHITIRAEMQAIINNPELKSTVEAAFSEVTKRLPEIRYKTQLAISEARKQLELKNKIKEAVKLLIKSSDSPIQNRISWHLNKKPQEGTTIVCKL